jgi:hypothetical protein
MPIVAMLSFSAWSLEGFLREKRGGDRFGSVVSSGVPLFRVELHSFLREKWTV